MKLIIPVFIIILSLLDFSMQNDHYPYTDYIPNGKGIVRFHFVNVFDTSIYIYYYNTHLPSDQDVKRFIIYSDSLIELEVKATLPIVNYLQENGPAQFMVLPNDTVDIIIDRKKNLPLSEIISFKGKTSKISDYLSKAKVWLYDNFPNKDELPKVYNSRIDSMYLLALRKLEDYNSEVQLPEWFMEFEKINIICYCEMLKQMQYNQRYWKYNQFMENKIGPTSDMKKKEMKINWLTDNTFEYLSIIRPDKYDTLLMPQYATTDIFFQYTRDNINALKGRLSDKMMSYFVASKLSIAYQVGIYRGNSKLEYIDRCKKVDSLFTEMTPLIKDSIILKFINEYKVKGYTDYLNQKKLVKGEKAPVFYLEDINGIKVNLSDFKGKLICLNFWGTYCSPCIKSIPQKNELVKKFSKSNFVLVNILMDYDFKKWKELIDKNKFEGIHLKCKGNWEKMLKENYQIKGVPHYTIIDKEGNIVINDVKRDSLDFYVKSNL